MHKMEVWDMVTHIYVNGVGSGQWSYYMTHIFNSTVEWNVVNLWE